MDRDVLAALAAAGGAIAAKGLDLLIARIRRDTVTTTSREALFAEETRRFRVELGEEVKAMRVELDHTEAENHQLREQMIQLREEHWKISRDKDALRRHNEQMSEQIAHVQAENRQLEGRVRTLQERVAKLEQEAP